MTSLTLKRFTPGVVVIAIIIGCGSVVQQMAQNNGSAVGGQQVESEFSTAPISPGGTGGVVASDPALAGEETRSFFKAFQIDPEAEDTAGPKFVIAADINQDGLMDLVSGWNQSQPVQLHLQQRDANDNLSFRTINLGGTTPIAVIAGVEVGQINGDGWLDIVVLSKATGLVTLCPNPPGEISRLEGEIIVLFSPGNANLIPDGDAWTEMILVNPLIQDPWIHNQFPGAETEEFVDIKTKPELDGFTALAVGEIDGRPGDDIIVGLNPGVCEGIGQDPAIVTVDLWVNPGPALAEQFDMWGAPVPDDPIRRAPVSIMLDAPQVRDIALSDIDSDGDLDVVAVFSDAISQNVRWARNPAIPSGSGSVLTVTSDGWRLISSTWERRTLGQVDSGADALAIGDIDSDGFDDVLVRSTLGQLVQWFRRPNPLTVQPEFPPNDTVPDRFNFTWPVFTLTEFTDQEPAAIGIGDLNGDGQVEVVAAAAGAVFWYDGTVSGSVFDPWFPNTIIQDSPPESAGTSSTPPDPAAAPGSGVGVNAVDTSTHVNTLLVVDLDGDGRNDIVGTLDRRAGSGLSDDRLVWYRNVRGEPDQAASRPASDKPLRP